MPKPPRLTPRLAKTARYMFHTGHGDASHTMRRRGAISAAWTYKSASLALICASATIPLTISCLSDASRTSSSAL